MLKKASKKGSIIVISAPSGAGKSSICNALTGSDSGMVNSVSCTTRAPRDGERDGADYFFIGESEFKRMIKGKKFAEWAKVHGNYYGTPKSFLEKTVKAGKDVLLDIDVQGGISIKKQYADACMIFIMTPDLKTLKQRLIARNKDSRQTIKMRLENARKELTYLKKYEYLVINDKLDEAVDEVRTIIKSQKYKIEK